MSSSDENDASKADQLQKKLTELAELAGGLAHEIRNPLSTISLNLQILKEELSPPESVRDRRMQERIVTTEKECRRLEQFLNDFLQYARVLELNCIPTDLSDYVDRFIADIRPDLDAAGIEVSPHLSADLPPVSLDREILHRALRNLARNAQESMRSGGVLEFQTYRSGEEVILEIIDTGEGIPSHVCQRIFETFFSTKPGGSGLGLPTVRKIVEAHGGSIQCASEVGKGTRFRIAFPVEQI